MAKVLVISKIYNDVLTPEQRKKVDELREHMHERAEKFLNAQEHPTD